MKSRVLVFAIAPVMLGLIAFQVGCDLGTYNQRMQETVDSQPDPPATPPTNSDSGDSDSQ